jgi:hypothetical protein
MSGKVWLGEQETPSSCGAASLKYALCLMGFSSREEQLRRLAHTTWRGTPTQPLLAAARRFGLEPRLRAFGEREWVEARAWLRRELAEGHPVILDVEGFNHYVLAVRTLGPRVVIINPEGATLRGLDYAQIVLAADWRLRSWWLSKDHAGASFRGISLTPPAARSRRVRRPTGPRLSFGAAALRRAMGGRQWVLDEYLIDAVEIATRARNARGHSGSLAGLVRRLGARWLVARVAFWHQARPAAIAMLKAHVEDLAVAAEAMGLQVPSGAVASVAVDIAALLGQMLSAED